MTKETGTIVLGGESFAVQAFTLDELQKAIPLLNAYHDATFKSWAGKAVATAESIAAAKAVLALAMRKTPEEIGALPASALEVFQALEDIARIGGLVGLGELMVRMMPQNSTGSPFTPTSSPLAPEVGPTSDA